MLLHDLVTFLDRFFESDRYGDDQNGVYHSGKGPRPVRRLGLALEPWARLGEWAEEARLDALFLHRPWTLRAGQLPPDVGVVAYHLPFDERLTLGYNPRLADALGLYGFEVLGEKEGRPLGMVGQAAPRPFAACRRTVEEVFGGCDEARPGAAEAVTRIAVVGAMNDALVREAHERGAGLYVTGQWRQPAARAVHETGMAVLAVGHRRSEEWGLRALAGVLRERWNTLEVVLPPPDGSDTPE